MELSDHRQRRAPSARTLRAQARGLLEETKQLAGGEKLQKPSSRWKLRGPSNFAALLSEPIIGFGGLCYVS